MPPDVTCTPHLFAPIALQVMIVPASPPVVLPFKVIVSDAAADGHFHLLNGLGHCSLFRHKPKVVADKIREIISYYSK